MSVALRWLGLRILRAAGLLLLAMLATTALVRFAPGYFADSREMDAQHGAVVRSQLQAQQTQGSLLHLVTGQFAALAHGDLGRSRQFDVPVTELLGHRIRTTAFLLAGSVLSGWLFAIAFALPLAVRRTAAGEALIAAPSAVLLAMPVGAMATACLLLNHGGPMLVLALLIAARDFKLVYRLTRYTLEAPHFLYARAQGIGRLRIMRAHLVPALGGELMALAMTSTVLALSACVPVEVLFDVPGLGQLAWNAAMNRDLPVLLAVTLLMAACVGVAAIFTDARQPAELRCA